MKDGRGSTVSNLKHILDDKIEDQYDLEIIFVTKTPELAEIADVICTPTLIKETPLPSKRIIGHFMDKEKVLNALELN